MMNQLNRLNRDSLAICLAATLVLFLAATSHAYPQHIVFPADAGVANVKNAPYNAIGDGVADDTRALQLALNANSGSLTIYLPKGKYRITKKLTVHVFASGSDVGPFVYGEYRDSTIIKLDDNKLDSGAVIQTVPVVPQSADWFARTFCNFTLDVGNNPKVDGINYFSNNSGMLKDLVIKGKGRCGIRCDLGQNGPNAIQDVEIQGFKIGIYDIWGWGQTLSHVTIRNCDSIGLFVSANCVAVESLSVTGTPTAVYIAYPPDWLQWTGMVSMLDCNLSGSDPTKPGIVNYGILYAHNLKTSGFSMAIKGMIGDLMHDAMGPNVPFYSAYKQRKAFAYSPDTMLNLPIKREPFVPWETDMTKWLCANDYGITSGDGSDDMANFQKAFDAAAAQGKTTVYIRGNMNWYNCSGSVYITGSVRHVFGLGFARIIG